MFLLHGSKVWLRIWSCVSIFATLLTLHICINPTLNRISEKQTWTEWDHFQSELPTHKIKKNLNIDYFLSLFSILFSAAVSIVCHDRRELKKRVLQWCQWNISRLILFVAAHFFGTINFGFTKRVMWATFTQLPELLLVIHECRKIYCSQAIKLTFNQEK